MPKVEENLTEDKSGIYLIYPHGKMIYDGEKTLIVLKKKFAWENTLKYLISGDDCYGIIRIEKIYPISLSKFKELENRHKISELERARWWTNVQELFAYEFNLVKKFPKPKKVILAKDVQTSIKEVKLLSDITYEEESKVINENKKTEKARKPHKFTFAHWTYKNGHPRCLVCGDEELTEEACKEKGIPKGWCEGIQSDTDKLEEIIDYFQDNNEFSPSFSESFELGIRQAFGSPGGKSRVANKLASFIPKHKTYIEAFAGGAAVYFAKEPSETEILNDSNHEIAFAFRFLKNITEEQIKKLTEKNWNPSELVFKNLLESKPENPVDRFYKFYYLMRHSYGFSMKSFNPRKSPNIDTTPEKFIRLRERLKNTVIYCEDWKKTMQRFNHSDSFAYLDPPYPIEWPKPGEKGFTKEECKDMHDFLKSWKGKFMLTLNSEDWIRKMFSDFKIRKFRIRRQYKHNFLPSQFELMITNYDVSKPMKLSEKYAPVGPSEKHNLGKPMYWKEVARNWQKPIMLVEDFIQLIGGVPSHEEGSTGDVDILIRKRKPEKETDDIPLKFRLFRAQPKEIRKRLHFVYDDYFGPFTDHVPIYHLVLMPVETQEVHEMSEKPWARIWEAAKDLDKISKEELIERHDWVHDCYKSGLGPKDDMIQIHALIWREMNRRALDHSKISPNDELDKKSKSAIEEYPKIPKEYLFEKKDAFIPRFLKPMSGYEKFEFADPEKLWDLWKEKYVPLKPIYINPKWDGFSFNLMKSGSEVNLITEDKHRDRASILPQVAEEVNKLPLKNCNITAECVWYKEGKALEREEAIGVIVGKEPMPEEDVRMYCYDISYVNGQHATKEPYYERLKILDKIFQKEYKHLKPTPRKLVKDKKTFMEWAKKFAEVEGSEGIMAKATDFKFITKNAETGRTTQMSKWKQSYDIEVEVDKPQPKVSAETKKPIPGQWIYHVIVRGQKDETIPVGRTFSTAIKAEKGDILTVRTARLRGFYDPEKKQIVKFSMMWPKVLGKRTDVTKPTSFKELMKIAWFPKKTTLATNGISLKFLGTRGNIEESNPKHKFHNGLIIEYRGKRILLDFGENLEGKLKEINPDAIFITHAHPDHYAGLKGGTSKPVYASKDALEAMKGYLLEDIRTLEPEKTVKVFDFRVTPYPIYHSSKSLAFGFLVEVANKRIVFASDVISFINKEKVLEGADLYIGDGSSPIQDVIRRKDDKIFGHSSIKTQIEECDRFDIPDAIFTHFGKEFIENEKKWIEELKKISDKVDVSFAFDGAVFKTSELEQELSKKLRYSLTHHWRGASVHADFRFEENDHLIGFTLADAEEEVFSKLLENRWKLEKEDKRIKLYWDDKLFYEIDTEGHIVKAPSETIKRNVYESMKGFEKIKKGWKVDWETGQEKIRLPTEGLVSKTNAKEKIGKVEKIWSDFKATQPKSWLSVEGVTPPRAIEATPGGTYHYPGIFVTINRGTYEPGVQKPYFREFFVDKFGRVVFRLVTGMKTKNGFSWLYWKPDSQTPYMLTKRALDSKTLPPSGISWLPMRIENMIPKEMWYWVKGLSHEECFKRLKESIDFWEGREMEMSYELDKPKYLQAMK